MRALNRHVERVFNPDRKEHHWGRHKTAPSLTRAGSLRNEPQTRVRHHASFGIHCLAFRRALSQSFARLPVARARRPNIDRPVEEFGGRSILTAWSEFCRRETARQAL